MSELAVIEQQRTALYRHFDAEGKLLYVGISLSALHRLGQHSSCSHWFDRIARVEIKWFESRKAASDAERAAVKEESPECNIVLRKTAKELANEKKAQMQSELVHESRQRLVKRYVGYDICYKPNDVRKMLGVTTKELEDLMSAGKLRYFEVDGGARHGKPPIRHKRITGWALIDFIEFLDSESRRANIPKSASNS